MRSGLALLTGLLAFAISAAAVPSTASFPGRNGTILAVTGTKLYSISADGRRRGRIGTLRVPQTFKSQAAWSPDGTKIVFTRRGGGIFVADARGGHARMISKRGNQPAWSPDATRVVLTRGEWLYVVGADGRGLEKLFRGSRAQWSPDGLRLAFERHDQVGTNVEVAAIDGSGRTQIARASSGDCGPSAPGRTEFGHPAWAPDGRRLAFVERSSCGSSLYLTIYASSPDGAGRTPLVEPNGGTPDSGGDDPAWSPDGSALAYFYDDGVDWSGLSVLRFRGKDRAIAKNVVPLDWRPMCALQGGPKSDQLRGRASGELICGDGGADRITGGAGSDRLFGEDGNDRFLARDRGFDVIGCGAGRDTVVADRRDLVGRDCEVVKRG